MSNKKMKCMHLFIFFVLCFILLSLRIIYFKVFKFKELASAVDSQYSYTEKASELKYLILDKNGKELLNYNHKYFVVIDPYIFINNMENTNIDQLYALKYILKNYNSTYELPNKNIQYKNRIYYPVDKSAYDTVMTLKEIKGVYCYTYSQVDRGKFYKIENIIATAENSKDASSKSDSSIESMIQKDTQKNKYPEYLFEKDINGSISQGKFIPPNNNINIRLTIDKNVQDIIEKAIDEKYKKYKQIAVVLMESETGKIQALVQKDNSEPNTILGGIGDGFVPGSIFKTIVEESAIENNKISQNEEFISTGLYDKEKRNIGKFTVGQAYVKSINHIFAQVGNKIGFNTILDTAKDQGMLNNEKVLNFRNEKKGKYAVPSGVGDISLLSIGQNMEITPIQALSIPNTVINGGVYVKPYIIDAYVDNDNNTIKTFNTESRQVISKNTADIMKEQMMEVVNSSEGTANAAYIKDIELGGKTGTSTRVETSKDNPSKLINHSDGWFAGFFRVNGKYYSIIVFVKDIDFDNDYASTTAVPVFKDIVELLTNYYK